MYTKALSTVFLLLELVSLATARPHVEKRSFKVERVRNDGYTGRNGPRALAKVYRKYGMPLPDGLVNALEAQDNSEAASFQPTKRRTSKWHSPMEDAGEAVGTENVGVENVSIEEVGAGDADAEDAGTEGAGTTLDGILGTLFGNGNGNAAGNGANNEGGNRAGKGAGNAAGNGANNEGGNRAGKGAGNAAGNGANNEGGGKTNGGKTNGGKVNGGRNGNNSTSDPNQDVIAALARARKGNFTGVVQTIPEKNDVEYLSQVKIGGQPIPLDFDTGSSDLWVFNTKLPATATANRQVYDPDTSDTFKMIQGAKFTIRYGDGSGAEGVVGTDVVDVGGAVAPKQAVELATTVTDTFVQDTNNGGLLGLAFGSINAVKPEKQKTQQMGGVVVPCEAQLPDLDLDIGGAYMARIKGKDINFAPVGDGTCFGGLQASPVGGLAVYGDIMFKSQFVVFHGGNNSLGMANHV
ncbi:hypothetical protein LLEC1_02833 [Akanthomyces lecanii]|uniref:Peptidase A1 domain-containing protein n=1 Tax=Cordyceps confragosa TaxID=2714763 RepID=A0A179HYW6_CORDF|nr:hypothetical protein LLEC1_02833 [Akanthomyces lecanii]